MKLPFRLPFTGRKAAVAPTNLTPTYDAWSPLLYESFGGAWQRGVKVDLQTTATFPAAYGCMTLIAADCAKLRLRLLERDEDGILQEVNSPAFSPVLKTPNRYQTRNQFIQQWVLSKLMFGNAYILKVRDNRGVVVALYPLDPSRVQPLVAPGAAVFYRLHWDYFSPLEESVTVPGSEIIHDLGPALYNRLVGVSPMAAAGMAAQTGVEIERTAGKFFENGARPGGILSAPGKINDETAHRLKSEWDSKFGGENVGKVAVLGDGLKFEHLSVNPVDAQLIEQLKYSAEMVAMAFHMPPFKLGIGQGPTNDNIQALNIVYYNQCLQKYLEDIEALLMRGLKVPDNYEISFDIDDLLRMDSQTQMMLLKEAVGAKLMSPNEGRRKLNLPPKEGGDDLWGQQQDHSLGALARRDAQYVPNGGVQPLPAPAPAPAPAAEADDDDDNEDDDEAERGLAFVNAFRKALHA